MGKSLVIGSALAAVATHGLVSSAMDLRSLQPLWTYQGFFQHIVLGIWRLWSEVHGWEGPGELAGLTHSIHVDDFGRFYAHTVFFIGPLLGFEAFALASHRRLGRQWWKPLAIAIAFTTPLQELIRHPLLAAGFNEPLAEAARAAGVFVLMAWSIGAIRRPRWSRPHQAPQSLTA